MVDVRQSGSGPYFATIRPTDHANIIVHNDEPQQPVRETRTH